MEQVYVVTGASGFLGSTVLKRLTSANCRVRALVLPGDNAPSLEGERCQVFHGDVTQMETLQDIFTQSPAEKLVVIHCAAIVSIQSKRDPQVFHVNVGGTENIIQKCLETNARMVYVNSVHAIPEPVGDGPITEVDSFSPDRVVGQFSAKSAELDNKLEKLSDMNTVLNAVSDIAYCQAVSVVTAMAVCGCRRFDLLPERARGLKIFCPIFPIISYYFLAHTGKHVL